MSRGLWVVVVCLGCGAATRPREVVVTTPPPPTAHAVASENITLDGCTLGARRLMTDAPSAWGSTSPSVWLTTRGTGLEVWYPSGYRGPHKTARLERDGSLGDGAEIEPFSAIGEADNPAVVEEAGVVAYAETVYRTQQDADVVLTLRFGASPWSAPIVLMRNPELDEEPAMAFSGGSLAVAWKHGAYPSAPDVALAIITQGSVLNAKVIERDVEAEGLAVAPVANGWLVLFTPSSALGRADRGLVALAVDRQGRVTSRTIVTKNAALWPVAAWNGREVGVAFRDETDGQSVGFVRLAPDGHPVGTVVVADKHPDPLASFRPLSLVPDKAGWWLADVASFHASVMIARASEGRVIELDPNGQPKRSVVVSERAAGAAVVRLAHYGAGVRGVFVEDRGEQRLRAFDIACDTTQTAPPADSCAAHTAPYAPDHFAALQGYVDSAIELGGDLVVGFRPIVRGQYGPSAGNVIVSRMSSDGGAVWQTDLGANYHPGLAGARGHIATLIQTGSGAGQSIVVLDAAKGTIVQQRATAQDAGAGCIAATSAGWLVVSGAPNDHPGKPVAAMLADDGSPRDRRDLDDPIQACTLLPTPTGFLLAYTHAGPMSETAWLFTRELDDHGHPRGAGARIPDVGFATSPVLVRRGTQPVILFGDALGRNLSAIVLDDHGAPKSRAIDIAQTYGLSGFAVWRSEIVWGTDAGLGRRGCLDQLL
jgi:hypothetical protein